LTMACQRLVSTPLNIKCDLLVSKFAFQMGIILPLHHVDAEQIDDCLRERNVGGTTAALDALGARGSSSSEAREAVEAARMGRFVCCV
jgi:hypothetical protein